MRSVPPVCLTVLASPGTQVQGTAGGAAYDFGQVGGSSRTPLVHTFLLRNDGKGPLTLDHLQPSCGCTSASLLTVSPPGTAAPATFGPHRVVPVQVSVDPTLVTPGDAHKTVWVFVRGQAAPAAMLVMTGTVLPAAAFDPPGATAPAASPAGAGATGAQPFQVTLMPVSLEWAGSIGHDFRTGIDIDLGTLKNIPPLEDV